MQEIIMRLLRKQIAVEVEFRAVVEEHSATEAAVGVTRASPTITTIQTTAGTRVETLVTVAVN